jgi:hypothetical protein
MTRPPPPVGLVRNRRRRRPRPTQNAWVVAGTFVLSMLTTLALWIQALTWLR